MGLFQENCISLAKLPCLISDDLLYISIIYYYYTSTAIIMYINDYASSVCDAMSLEGTQFHIWCTCLANCNMKPKDACADMK